MPWHFLIQDPPRGTETPLPSAPGLSHEPLSGSSPFIGHFSTLYPGGHKICGMHRQGRRIQTVGGLGVQKHKGGMLYTLWVSWETNIAPENCMLQLSSRMLYCNCYGELPEGTPNSWRASGPYPALLIDTWES